MSDFKRCPCCEQHKPFDQYNRGRFAGLAFYCRACSSAKNKASYAKHKDVVGARVKARRQKYRRLIMNYLLRHPCVDCGESDPRVLEFDHRDPAEKKFNISISVTRNWDSLMDEIDKCDIRCANCHRRRTAEQFGWFKHSYLLGTLEVSTSE